MRYVITGSGIAAFEAAINIRRLDPDADLEIFTREKILPYRRPALPRMLTGDLPDSQFFIKNAEYFARENIPVSLGCELLGIDRQQKKLFFSNGGSSVYDKLLLALGSEPFVPPLPGCKLDNVCTMRSYQDMLFLRERLQHTGVNPLIIGGGLLGLELADAILQTGHKVTVVEGQERLLPRQLTPEQSAEAAGFLAGRGTVSLFTGSPPEALLGENAVSGVRLQNGTEIASGLVIFSAGVRPNIRIAQDCGVETVPFGIKTDMNMQTSDPDIFAAGDCVSLNGGPAPGLFLPARDMGRAAACAMTGHPEPYTAGAYPARLQALGMLFADGRLTFPGA